ncbi:hypothetical protein OH76DRAFT_1425989 [Lentinus brumalis]|uniref:Uncharacterized protein n=1 Tax=Lentinus brumalis TaxID=2498619 RepID=A0A371DVG2_9APHY|nr:hypothetical protein OH76DRAFT_1425989 [Polyporus brumalis]
MTTRSAAGSATSLSESRAEALQALLDSLAPGAEARGEDRLKADQVRKISDKLGELLGDDVIPDMGQRNAKGELVNEEGLPIVDIVEPVPQTDGPSSTAAASVASGDTGLIPLWALSPAEQARSRAERNRIFDLLEEEERIQQAKEEEEEREQFKVDLEKRRQAAEAEMNALKKAREMQKKMGKALLRNLAEARDREEKEKRELEEKDKEARAERQKLKPRKSVTFADLPPDHEYQPANSVPMPPPFDWGDVAPAKLQTGGKNSLLTKAQMDKGPMRMNVVERVPGITRGPKSPPPPTQPDSDDESEPGSPVPADSDEGEIIISDNYDSEDQLPSQSHDDSDESDYGVEDSEPVEWDDEGYDFARHQREIALAYYEKRATVGAEALAAMRNHEHTDAENEWDQPMVPLDASLASSPPKPSASRFKSSRSSATSTLPSQSLGANILPASQSSTLKSAVRLGKLEDDMLVGGEEGESDDEIHPAAKEMLEMLKKGEVVNVGPTAPANIAGAVRAAATSQPTTSNGDVSPEISATTSSVSNEAPVAHKPKVSKVSQFKMSFSEPSVVRGPVSPGSALVTPTNTNPRSSPKLPSLAGTPIAVPTRTSYVAGPSKNAPVRRPAEMPGMIVDSPSFPAPGVLTSPSFPGADSSSSTPAFNSMIIESPSFLSSSSTVIGTSAPSSLPATPPAGTPVSASVVERRPIVASQVRESTSTTSRSADSTPTERKKVSRFLAQRS